MGNSGVLELLKLETSSNFNDMFGTASVFKKKASALKIDATERFNNFSQSFDESRGNSEMLNDFQVYPLGNNLFKYGHWLVEENFSGEDDPHDELYETGAVAIRIIYQIQLL